MELNAIYGLLWPLGVWAMLIKPLAEWRIGLTV